MSRYLAKHVEILGQICGDTLQSISTCCPERIPKASRSPRESADTVENNGFVQTEFLRNDVFVCKTSYMWTNFCTFVSKSSLWGLWSSKQKIIGEAINLNKMKKLWYLDSIPTINNSEARQLLKLSEKDRSRVSRLFAELIRENEIVQTEDSLVNNVKYRRLKKWLFATSFAIAYAQAYSANGML